MLVIVDRFSHWIEAVPSKGPDVKTVVNILCKEVCPRFGIPHKISSDNGAHFVNKVMKEVTKLLGIKQRLVNVYHYYYRGPYNGPALEQLERELFNYSMCTT